MIATLWILSAIAPLLTAAALGATHRARSSATTTTTSILVRWAPLALLPAGVLAILGPDSLAEAPWLVLGTVVGLDVISRALLLVAVLLYGAACVSVTWRHDERAPELIAYLLVCFVGNAGVYVAADVVTFYLCFALMSFAAVGLVIHNRTDRARRASRIYLVLAVASEAAILIGLLLVAAAGSRLISDAPAAVANSPHRTLTVALLIIGFGLKAGLFSLHVWLPLAHPAAPPPASAVLSGAMVKAGLVGWLRFLPLGWVDLRTAGAILVVLSLLGAFLAVPAGVLQRDPKAVLAYSTISQMGFVGAAVGVALMSPALAPACITATVIYAVHHGLAKGALFIGVPVWKHHGTGARRHLVTTGLIIASLAVVGGPFSTGAIGKYAVKEAIDDTSVLGLDLVSLLPFVATGSTVLLMRLMWLLKWADLEPLAPQEDPELPAWLILVVTSATIPWLLTNRWVPLADVPGLEGITLWEASWPVLLGLGVGALAWRFAPRREGGGALPPGDLVVPIERLAAVGGTALSRVGDAASATRSLVSGRRAGAWDQILDAGRASQRREESLSGWQLSGLAILAVLAVLITVAVIA